MVARSLRRRLPTSGGITRYGTARNRDPVNRFLRVREARWWVPRPEAERRWRLENSSPRVDHYAGADFCGSVASGRPLRRPLASSVIALSFSKRPSARLKAFLLRPKCVRIVVGARVVADLRRGGGAAEWRARARRRRRAPGGLRRGAKARTCRRGGRASPGSSADSPRGETRAARSSARGRRSGARRSRRARPPDRSRQAAPATHSPAPTTGFARSISLTRMVPTRRPLLSTTEADRMTLADLRGRGSARERARAAPSAGPRSTKAPIAVAAALTRRNATSPSCRLRACAVVASGRSSESSATKTGIVVADRRPVGTSRFGRKIASAAASLAPLGAPSLASGLASSTSHAPAAAMRSTRRSTVRPSRWRCGTTIVASAAAASGIGSMPGAVPVSHSRAPCCRSTPSRSTSTTRSRTSRRPRLGATRTPCSLRDGCAALGHARRRSHGARASATTGSSSNATRATGRYEDLAFAKGVAGSVARVPQDREARARPALPAPG